MPVRFIRQPKETPNVSNADDARMIRYAYGGQDGYIQNAGSELSYTIIGNLFRINSGVVVLQGWESEIDSNGWAMTVDNVVTKRYYSIYYEVNLATQTTSIQSVYDTAGYPEIDKGDDLTALQTGIARLLLYQFTAQNGVISDVSKKVNVILYGTITSNRPPISSISFVNGSVGKLPNILQVYKQGRNIIEFDVGYSSSSIVSSPICIPSGSGNSIAKIEITQSDTNLIEYAVRSISTSSFRLSCYAKKDLSLSGEGYSGASQYKHYSIDVQAKITDLYGNEFLINWVLKFIDLDDEVV